jgi:hypothetical protein
MSIWADIHKRSNGTAIRKEDKVIPEKPQENCLYGIPDHPSKWNYDSGNEIYKRYYVSDLDDLLDKLENDYNFFKF